MINEKEARDIAGGILIEHFGREFLIQNKERLSIMYAKPQKGYRVFHFDMFEKETEEIKIERDGGIYVEEKNFPERILSVEVRLKDGSARIIEEDE